MNQINRPLFFHGFNGYVWKIRLDFQEKVLICEIRNEEERKVSFFGIDPQSAKIRWKYESEEDWWVSLYQSGFGKTILNGLEGYENPQVKGLEVIDTKSGKLILKEKELIPLALQEDELLVKVPGEKESLSLLNFNTGKTASIINLPPVSGVRENDTIVNPNSYTKENPFFSRLAHFVKFISGLQPVEVIEYLEYNHKIIVSFYVLSEEKLVNYLFVTDEDGNVLVKEELGRDLKGMASDTYFLSGDLLIFVKKRKELFIFEL